MPGLLVDLDLVDRREDVLDRVLDRHDVALGAVDLAERSRRASSSCRCRSGRRRSPCRTASASSVAVAARACRRACRARRARTAAGSCRAAAARTFSPQIVAGGRRRGCRRRGRRSSIAIWPSCGRRRSTMFMSAMILMRLTSAGPIAAGQRRAPRAARRRCGTGRARGRPAARCGCRRRGRAAPG